MASSGPGEFGRVLCLASFGKCVHSLYTVGESPEQRFMLPIHHVRLGFRVLDSSCGPKTSFPKIPNAEHETDQSELESEMVEALLTYLTK